MLRVKGRLWYLAHPVSPDEHFTFEQNMKHALTVARICFEHDFLVDLFWHPMCQYLDNENPHHRELGLQLDCQVAVERGRIILSGHRISSGMVRELDAVMASGGKVLDLIGVPDRKIGEVLTRHIRRSSYYV